MHRPRAVRPPLAAVPARAGAALAGAALAAAAVLAAGAALAGAPARGAAFAAAHARAAGGRPFVELVAPAGGAFAPNAGIVLLASAACDRLAVSASAGKGPLAADLLRWPELRSHRPGLYYVLRPTDGAWPAGATVELTVSCAPGKLRAKIGTTADRAAPRPARLAAPVLARDGSPEGAGEDRLHLSFGAVTDAAPVVCMRIRLADPVRRVSSEVEGAFATGASSHFSLPARYPSCLTGGIVTDTAGNVAPVPAAACAKSLPPDLRAPVAAPCAGRNHVDDRLFDGLEL